MKKNIIEVTGKDEFKRIITQNARTGIKLRETEKGHFVLANEEGMAYRDFSDSEKYKILAKNAFESGFFAALGAVSMPVSITASAGYSLLQASIREAEKTNNDISNMPIRSDFSDKWLGTIIDGYDNSVDIKNMNNELIEKVLRYKQNGF